MLVEHGGVLIVDNVISHAAEVKSFIKEVKQDERFYDNNLVDRVRSVYGDIKKLTQFLYQGEISLTLL